MKKIRLVLSSSQIKGFFLFVEVCSSHIEKDNDINYYFIKEQLFKLYQKLQLKIINLKDKNNFILSLPEAFCMQSLIIYGFQISLKGLYDYELSVYRKILRDIDQQITNFN
ncbi:MAG: hypothetical protein NTZ33_13965 [Bacteroidetes bacterium]|nr:hypothetical protein [Bacteroidota bacterium]